MDVLHTGRFRRFVIVSSDSDFTRLASRIREEGGDVIGIGERKTSKSLRNAYRSRVLSNLKRRAKPSGLRRNYLRRPTWLFLRKAIVHYKWFYHS